MEKADDTTGIIILAAGASTRMGQAKQLLRIAGESLIERAVKTALGTTFRPLVVVLGANRELIEPELLDSEALKVFNPDWPSGMGSSIATGLVFLLEQAPTIQQVLILVGDQPLLEANTLYALVELQARTQAPLVVSGYTDTLGVPALFTSTLFAELAALHGAQGAKKLIEKYRDQAVVLDFPEGALDLDTPEDWAAFLTKINV
ncbi:MAG: nucleotidyltransferase family protein [Haliscomenobacter sp.]|uniref:nucleotidyltransferase family protein n=1 Tax=Haliscomenobacter sp. TaxID=2717303 RepID=UPI0029AF0A38|nr:nucleotidyltransferase family protein [Haliscomenobacter sp.]MDX2071404.1 nucleotidyltransferase family protein [Haliscomenobacter sp.]